LQTLAESLPPVMRARRSHPPPDRPCTSIASILQPTSHSHEHARWCMRKQHVSHAQQCHAARHSALPPRSPCARPTAQERLPLSRLCPPPPRHAWPGPMFWMRFMRSCNSCRSADWPAEGSAPVVPRTDSSDRLDCGGSCKGGRIGKGVCDQDWSWAVRMGLHESQGLHWQREDTAALPTSSATTHAEVVHARAQLIQVAQWAQAAGAGGAARGRLRRRQALCGCTGTEGGAAAPK
jgi:hypothetical protein